MDSYESVIIKIVLQRSAHWKHKVVPALLSLIWLTTRKTFQLSVFFKHVLSLLRCEIKQVKIYRYNKKIGLINLLNFTFKTHFHQSYNFLYESSNDL